MRIKSGGAKIFGWQKKPLETSISCGEECFAQLALLFSLAWKIFLAVLLVDAQAGGHLVALFAFFASRLLALTWIKAIDRNSFERGNFLVLRPALLKIAYFNSGNRQLSIAVLPKELRQRKIVDPSRGAP